MPECIFCIKPAVFENSVFNILEGIFSFQLHISKLQICGTHHKIFTLSRTVFHLNILYRPAKLRRKNITVFHLHISAFPQCLNPVELRAGDLNMVGIPQCRTAELGHFRIADLQPMIMPERIPQIKKAVLHLYIRTFLECAFSVSRAVKGTFLHQDPPASIKRPFLIKCLSLYCVHILDLPVLFPFLYPRHSRTLQLLTAARPPTPVWLPVKKRHPPHNSRKYCQKSTHRELPL